jgi:hypothetical protein
MLAGVFLSPGVPRSGFSGSRFSVKIIKDADGLKKPVTRAGGRYESPRTGPPWFPLSGELQVSTNNPA